MVLSSTVADYRCARIPAIRISTRVQLEECDALLTGGTDSALERDDNRRTGAAQLEAANNCNGSEPVSRLSGQRPVPALPPRDCQ